MEVSISLQLTPRESASDRGVFSSKRTNLRVRLSYIASRYMGLVSLMYVPRLVTEGVLNETFTYPTVRIRSSSPSSPSKLRRNAEYGHG